MKNKNRFNVTSLLYIYKIDMSKNALVAKTWHATICDSWHIILNYLSIVYSEMSVYAGRMLKMFKVRSLPCPLFKLSNYTINGKFIKYSSKQLLIKAVFLVGNVNMDFMQILSIQVRHRILEFLMRIIIESYF